MNRDDKIENIDHEMLSQLNYLLVLRKQKMDKSKIIYEKGKSLVNAKKKEVAEYDSLCDEKILFHSSEILNLKKEILENKVKVKEIFNFKYLESNELNNIKEVEKSRVDKKNNLLNLKNENRDQKKIYQKLLLKYEKIKFLKDEFFNE